MARGKRHKAVEFAVDDASKHQRIFKTFDEAAGFAASISATNGLPVNVDVLIYSKAGARWWGGEHAVEDYREDPEASVSERIAISAEFLGKVY